MFKGKVPVLYLLLVPMLCIMVTAVATEYVLKSGAERKNAVDNVVATVERECEYHVERLHGYKHIGPMYMAERNCESQSFLSLKSQIDVFANDLKTAGELTEMSVYIKDLNTGSWMDYNPNATYLPGSLLKVVIMITVFRMSEQAPALLDKVVAYNLSSAAAPPTQTFNTDVIKPGGKYTVKELVRRMIVNSDNHATMLLHGLIDERVYRNVLTDLGMPISTLGTLDYRLSVKEYSKFLSVLYDGGYLTIPASEVATSLLSECVFNGGITKQLPQQLTVAHKFGEAGQPGAKEFHESAIIYLSNRPYLLTVMTKGKDARVLASVISEVSKFAYDHMVAAK